MLGAEKIEGNWFMSNFKNGVPQQKKTPNKSTRSVVN